MLRHRVHQHRAISTEAEIGFILEQLQHDFEKRAMTVFGEAAGDLLTWNRLQQVHVVTGLIKLAGQDQSAYQHEAEITVANHLLFRQLRYPADQRWQLTGLGPMITTILQHAHKEVVITATLDMLQCRFMLTSGHQPAGSKTMQLRNPLRRLDLQTISQKLLEQAMKAMPARLLWQRLDKQLAGQQAFDNQPGIIAAGQDVAQCRAEALGNRAAQQQITLQRRQVTQHNLGKVFDQGRMAGTERQGITGVAVIMRQQGKADARQPAFGHLHQLADIGIGEWTLQGQLRQRFQLLRRQVQIISIDHPQLIVQLQPRQRQIRLHS